MADRSALLHAARDAHGRGDWRGAVERFEAARREGALSPDHLVRWADAAWWLGDVDRCVRASASAYRGYLEDGRSREAAAVAVDVAVSWALRGEEARASGWIARAQRLLADLPEGAEHGYLRYLVAVEGGLDGGDLPAVADAARAVQGIGRRHGDPNLVAMGVLGEARALIRSGAVPRGLGLLDEAMVAVLDDDLSPEWTGNLYCHLMATCHELVDVARARRWTEATAEWLAELPEAVVFTGICRVHRAQVHQRAGDWDRAGQEAAQVLDELAGVHVSSVAEAHHQLGELHRLRGDHDAAEAAYDRARQLGRDPQPGQALLHLARGRPRAAARSVDAALHAAAGDRLARARLHCTQVEIAIALGDLELAGRACASLEAAAATYGTSGLEAAALQWRGALALAEDHPAEALPSLRAACGRWHDVGAPYDVARCGALLGEAYRRLGDHEAASAELHAARDTFAQLGAEVDAGVVDRLLDGGRPGGLTSREAEVLALVATGLTNREVAAELVLSEKTIARHLSNTFAKLGVSTRTEASAYAFALGIAGPPADGGDG